MCRYRYEQRNARICNLSWRDGVGKKTLSFSQGFDNAISLLIGNIWMNGYRCNALYKSFSMRTYSIKEWLEEWTVICYIISITRNIRWNPLFFKKSMELFEPPQRETRDLRVLSPRLPVPSHDVAGLSKQYYRVEYE